MERISPQTLKEWILSDNPPAVVDVRDDDYFGGHIQNARNYPSSGFVETMDRLQSDVRGFDRVVFYCQLSQVRGPSCAKKYTLQTANECSQKVYVLAGGFSNWVTTFKGDLTEDFIPDLYK